MTPSTRSVATACAALVVATSAYFGNRFLALGIACLIVLAAAGWPRLMRIPSRRVGFVVIAASGAISVFAVALGRDEPYLRYAVAAAAAAVLLALSSEVFFPSPRGRAVSSVSGLAAGGLIAVSGAAWLATARTAGSSDLVVAASAALAVAALASTATRRAGINAALALGLGAVSGAATGYLYPTVTWFGGALVGIAGAASVLIVTELYRREPAARHALAGIASGITPVLIAGVLVYISGRLLVG